MRILHSPGELRLACDEARAINEKIGLVPTMGALHRGHATLIEEARKRAEEVVVTIFVNPTQFGPNEDFAKYPRTLDADVALAEKAGATVVFAPSTDVMYPKDEETRVKVGRTAAALCGVHRPIHFEGVATIVAKLFIMVGPCIACFGRKDYQQLRVVTRMATDLFIPVEIVGIPTVREADGLALSSRNRYLSERDRERAVAIPRGITRAAAAFARGERRAGALRALCSGEIEPVFDSVDYVALADADTVVPFEDDAAIPERALIAVAARIGGARLIDNMVLGEESPPRAIEEAS